MFLQIFMGMPPPVVEIFQSGAKWWRDQPTKRQTLLFIEQPSRQNKMLALYVSGNHGYAESLHFNTFNM